MTYNKNDTLRRILNEFLSKNVVSLKSYLEMLNNMDNFQLVDDFVLDCIVKFNISYVNYPSEYLDRLEFLQRVATIRKKVIKEIKNADMAVYNSLLTNTAVDKTEVLSQFPERKKGVVKLEKVC